MVCEFDLGGCVCVCTHAAENVQEGKVCVCSGQSLGLQARALSSAQHPVPGDSSQFSLGAYGPHQP